MILDFEPSKEVYDAAIDKIKTVAGLEGDPLGTSKAIQIFDDIRNPKNSLNPHETPELLCKQYKRWLTKRKNIKELTRGQRSFR